MPQAVMTLNMLRTSRINPKLSAATHIFGQYDFNRAPMAPPGTIIIAHETPDRRRTWAPHGQDGWYIGPSLEHYRCYTVYITKKRSNRIVETVDFFPQRFILPFTSSHDLATQAASDLTHALLHPQPAGPFCQVGDKQVIALKRLASIFASAKPRNKNSPLAPQDEIENNAPQRVQTTVSPLRVACTDQEQISLQHISSSQSTPNSHRRQQTPVRRIVTPHTPYFMVRRSARQHNLSQDMMAETINQANHCFSISSQTKCTQQQITNTDIIISPEMENAVICPETVISLKHQELITRLKYKIKWIKSTANEINRLFNTNTIRFIRRSDVPKGQKVTYGSFVVDIKDHKDKKECTRLTVGGDHIEYPGDKST
jgi:hypothetical protein